MLETFPSGNLKTKLEVNEGPSDAQTDALIDLLTEVGRAKVSLSSLVVRPVWRDELVRALRGAKIAEAASLSEDQASQWLPMFYRLCRSLHQSEGGLTMRAVAETVGVPLSSATRFVDGLVQRGLLKRCPDASDRRLVLVVLTAQGEGAFDVIDQALRARLQGLMQHFTPAEREQVIALGQRLFSLWSASLQEATPPIIKKEAAKP